MCLPCLNKIRTSNLNVNLGIAFKGLGKFQEAIDCYNKSLSIAQEECDRALEGMAYCNLGNVYKSLEKYQDAIEHYNKRLSVAKEVETRLQKQRLITISAILTKA